ncbi:MAG: DUF3619 family protein [Nitrosomonadales bacterium]|nr:DUF3619 family protein [Nitrosomonadales bacterium]
MNIKLSHKDIGRLLDRSARQVDGGTLEALHAARRHALLRQRSSTPLWIGLDGVLFGHQQLSRRAFGWLIAAAVATLLLINLGSWYHASEHNHGDIDIAILTDEMPVDVYID